MLSSTTTVSDETHYNSSSSSWSSSQSLQASATTPRQTMEEVWNDINLASLSDNHNHNNSPNFRNMALQDFLAQPFSNVMVSPSPDRRHHHHPPPPPPSQTLIPSPPTVLSLNPLGDSDQFQLFCIENLNTTRPIVNINLPMSNTTTVSADSSFGGASPFDALGVGAHHSSPSSGFIMPPVFGSENQRFPESGTGDRRHKRMIKNRESAARSRARKQAYTNELQIEVQHLMEENAKLRRLNEQLSNAAASQLPKKYDLQRSSTAPF